VIRPILFQVQILISLWLNKYKISSLFNLYAFLIVLTAFFSNANFSALYLELSTLEKSIVDKAMATYGLIPYENEPQGHIVRKIYIFIDLPFSKNSGYLTLLNYLHFNTREEVIRHQLFQKEGEVFDSSIIRDSEIALRNRSLVRSIAVIVPVKAKGSVINNEIDLLVVTKDLLSLQPTLSFKGYSGTITNLMVGLSEHNLLGRNKSIAGTYELQQGGHIISTRYFDPALFNSRFQLSIRPTMIFERENFKFDGFLGDFRIERPLISETDRWGYGIDTSFGSKTIIDFNGDKVRTFDILSTDVIETLERKYRWRYEKFSLFSRYSFGRTYKKEIFASYNLNIKRPSITEDSNLKDEERDDFIEDVLPKSELESYATIGFAHFHNKFLTLYDYNNYKLQENKRIGPILIVSNDFSSKKFFFSDHNFLRPKLKFSYLKPIYKDSFISTALSTSNRFDGEFTDNSYKFGLTLVIPKMWDLFRVVLEGQLSFTLNNRDNQKFVLGSDSGVRGVVSRFYSGEKAFRTNLELRTISFNFWIFHAGLVLFYDVGAAFDQWQDANATHALGFGCRLLAPQISSSPFRIDFAFPIYGLGARKNIIIPSFGTGQAF
jgi:hypothetical protein